ncbi:hypothetical protein BKA58DRAFT_94352 [Alternaria rosae]|uniref:uncharacterized protein n=1 Tax=Alternaria rosae TaxID=1187941 RepID=UPI001E8EC985|nr:uncharacterized protein BKA58DRAFT_94352 [Alternaria rosae]KAH6878385.1 hypothetical protein BKA58DRAFT_94352 [Alternaria rosae]
MVLAIAASGSRTNRRDNPIYIEVSNPPPTYTSGDCVQGQLIVVPTFQPKRISISLKGFSAVEDAHGRSVHLEFYGLSQFLYIHENEYDDFHLRANNTKSPPRVELPFTFTFGNHATIPPPAGRVWLHPGDQWNHPRFQHSPGFPLPPTLDGPTPTSPRVVYHLEAYMESDLPGTPPVRVRQEITYMPPAPSYDRSLLQPDLNFGTKLPKHCTGQKLIRTRKLLPNYAENSSKLGRFKDKLYDKELLFGIESFAEIPYAQFNVLATPPNVLVVGSLVPVIVTVQHIKRSESLPSPPDLFIRRLKVQLNAKVNVFLPNEAFFKHPSRVTNHTERRTIVLCDHKYETGDGEPLYDGLNLLDVANIELAKDVNIAPSFTSYGLNLEYELQIEIAGRCADREWSGIACTQPVQVVTDLQASSTAPPNPFEAGPGPLAYHELDAAPRVYEMAVHTEEPPPYHDEPPPYRVLQNTAVGGPVGAV